MIFLFTPFLLLFAIICFSANKVIGHLAGGLFCMVAAAGAIWVGVACFAPTEAPTLSRHEIKTVTYPDGTKNQMFTVDGAHYNANAKWSKVIDENEYEIEVAKPVTIYRGLDFSGTSSTQIRFSLVKKVVK
jgi:hypothetical protein